MKNSIISGLLAATLTLGAYAQSGTNSPYSQYGLGILSDQSQGFNRGMNGVGLGLRMGDIVNALNPASYSAIDSLTMIFDVGLSGQITNFKEGGKRINANNADFEYAVGAFRAMPHLGVSFGLLPLTNIGYNYGGTTYLNSTIGSVPATFSGSGGLHQLFVGAGWNPVKPLSVGVNVSYLWGNYTKKAASTGTTMVNALSKSYTANISSFHLEFGAQWEQRLNRANTLTLGATMSLRHKLGADPECTITNTNSATGVTDTTTQVVKNGLEMPMTMGVGLAWNYRQRLTVAADVTLQKWGDLSFPAYDDDTKKYALRDGLLKNRTKVNFGIDYIPNPADPRHFFNHVHYRLGAGFATPYYIINGQDGPKEFSVSGGFGVPVGRSMLNISAQWAHASATNLITENTFRINIGLTFNERWFAKWRVD